MNIHEHQAKQILKDYGAPVSNGVVILSLEEISEKIKKLKHINRGQPTLILCSQLFIVYDYTNVQLCRFNLSESEFTDFIGF